MSSPNLHSREVPLHKDFDALPGYTPTLPPVISADNDQQRPWYLTASWWLLITGTTSVMLGSLVNLVQNYLTTVTQHPIISSLLLVSNVTFIGLILWLLTRELIAYQRIKHLAVLPSTARTIIARDDINDTTKLLHQLTQAHSHMPLPQKLHQQFWQSIQAHHTAEERRHIYRQMVSEPLRKQAETLIQPAMLQAAGMSLISPNNHIHSLVLLWRSLKLVRDIAQVYGVRPGFFGSLQLLRLAIENMVIQQGVDMIIDVGVSRVGHGLLSNVIEQGSAATTTSLLLRRLAKATIRQLDVLSDEVV